MPGSGPDRKERLRSFSTKGVTRCSKEEIPFRIIHIQIIGMLRRERPVPACARGDDAPF
jgi:hypothetical protein